MPQAAAGIARLRSLALMVGVCLLLWLSPAWFDARTELVRGGILVALTIAAWAFGFLAEPVTALLFFLLAAGFAIAKPAVIFSGFASPAWWLVLGGAITGIAVERTGLSQRLATGLLRRIGASYRSSLAAVAFAVLGLAFVIPSSTARLMLLIPIVLALADGLGLVPGRPGRAGLVMTVAFVATLHSATILPANVAGPILLGSAEMIYGIKIGYASFLLLHFPILGVLKTVLLIEIVCRMFPEPEWGKPAPAPPSAPMSGDERVVAAVIATSLLFFVTDVVHGISLAWIALAAAVVCLLPGVGPLGAASLAQANFGMLLHVAAILGVGAVIADTGIATLVGGELLRLSGITPGHQVLNLAIITAIFSVIALLTTVVALPVVLVPLAGKFAAASGLPVLTILHLQVVVTSAMLFPYQNFLIVVAMQYGQISLRKGALLCLVQAAVTVVVLFPLAYAWWWLLGYLP